MLERVDTLEKETREWYEDDVCSRYSGDLKGLLSLFKGSGVAEREGIIHTGEKEGSVQTLGVCSLYGAFDVVMQIRDAVPIIHGPIGCCHLQLGFHIRMIYGSSRPPDRSFPIVACSNMQEEDIILGGAEKLKEAILTVDKELSPRLIVILGSCAPAIIGDYIPDIIKEVEDDVGADVFWMNVQGFAGRTPFAGFQDAYRILIDEVVEPPEKKLAGYLNILGEKSTEAGGEVNLAVMQRYFEPFGMKVLTRFVRSTTTADIKGMTRAQLNLIRCHEPGWKPAKMLKERFGMEYLEDDFPFGFAETDRWLRAFGEFLGQREVAEEVIAQEQNRFKDRIREVKSRLKGKRVILMGNGGRATSLLKFCAELGMRIESLIYWGPLHDRPTFELKEYLAETGDNIEVRISPDFYEMEALIKALKPDLALGDPSQAYLCLDKEVAFDNIHQAPQVGYIGAINLAERWIEAIRRPVYDGWLYKGAPLHSSQKYISQCLKDAAFCGQKRR